ncbi:MAG: hypothetical protein JWP89_5289 [Schlesneria sp.]|nr:hypothetical protein [Schlesneria sp.]
MVPSDRCRLTPARIAADSTAMTNSESICVSVIGGMAMVSRAETASRFSQAE